MTDKVQLLWERAVIGGLVWAVGVAVVVWALVSVGGGWGVFWTFVGLVIIVAGGTFALIGTIALGVKLGREAAELDEP